LDHDPDQALGVLGVREDGEIELYAKAYTVN